ncbi:hypothetical protein AL073_12270 [Loktanella sp. 1ANDIMAR09]|nr:hypothetical protein AL073_12270 [Loktanella sp. 1ANDIMAR09]
MRNFFPTDNTLVLKNTTDCAATEQLLSHCPAPTSNVSKAWSLLFSRPADNLPGAQDNRQRYFEIAHRFWRKHPKMLNFSR